MKYYYTKSLLLGKLFQIPKIARHRYAALLPLVPHPLYSPGRAYWKAETIYLWSLGRSTLSIGLSLYTTGVRNLYLYIGQVRSQTMWSDVCSHPLIDKQFSVRDDGQYLIRRGNHGDRGLPNLGKKSKVFTLKTTWRNMLRQCQNLTCSVNVIRLVDPQTIYFTNAFPSDKLSVRIAFVFAILNIFFLQWMGIQKLKKNAGKWLLDRHTSGRNHYVFKSRSLKFRWYQELFVSVMNSTVIQELIVSVFRKKN